MSLLKAQKKREGYRLVGVSIPLQDHNYLTLYALAHDTTKSRILSDQINKWIRVHKNEKSEKILMCEILRRIGNIWKAEKSNKKGKTCKQFKEALTQELSYKGIADPYLSQILNSITE